MPRKITSGIVGGQILGSLATSDNAFSSREANTNIVLVPDGTGVVESQKDLLISGNNGLRLEDGDTNYVRLKAPASIGQDYTLTFPADDGDNAQILQSDGAGVLTWTDPSLGIVNRTAADNTTYYVSMVSATSGRETEISVAENRLEFVPNPGRLSAAEIRSTANTASSSTSSGSLVVTGGVGVGGQLTAVTLVETSSITLKENITPIENGLDSILQLKGVTYDRLDNKEHESGLIAEWTENIIPELVTKDNDGKVVGIKYTKLSAYLIEAIKTLKAEIDELRGS